MAFARYYSHKEDIIFFLALGFLGAGILDGFHGAIAHFVLTGSEPDSVIFRFPWSWLAPRVYLSITLLIGVITYVRKIKKSPTASHKLNEKLHIALSTILTVTVFTAIFWTYRLFEYLGASPEDYFALEIQRPLEFIPALLFGASLIGMIIWSNWRNRLIEFLLILFLLINFSIHAFIMPFNFIEVLELPFSLSATAAHILKVISYLIILVALLINMYKNYKKAEMANAAKSEFLNIMSHELRTPLTIILGYTPLLQNPDKLPSTVKLKNALERKTDSMETIAIYVNSCLYELTRYVKKMDQSGQLLLRLINDMLDLSKIDADMMILSRQNIDLDLIINQTLDKNKAALNDKGLTLSTNIGKHIVFADPDRMTQIMDNLINNAIKFTERGLIDIQCRDKKRFIEISVSDTGCGIAPEKMTHIFNWFTQIDSTSTRYTGGIGLGLAITKSLVELHDGKITVNSTLGNGTNFTLLIPKAVD